MHILKTGLFTSLFFLAACGGKGGDSPPTIVEYEIIGDPTELIAGAKLDDRGPFKAENASTLENYSLMTASTFMQKTKKKVERTQEQVEKENAPPAESQEELSYELKVQKTDRSTFRVEVKNIPLAFVLKEDANDILQVTSVITSPGSFETRTLHWSQTPDKKMISVLMTYDDPTTGKGLLSLYFRSNDVLKKQTPIYEKVYQYLAGPGVGIGWKQDAPISLGICGDQDERDLAGSALKKWKAALEARLDVNLYFATSFAPFSDLNQRCIYRTNLYKYDAGGITVGVVDMRSSQLVDSDIIMFDHSFNDGKKQIKEKYPDMTDWSIDQVMRTVKEGTYTHELGHFFGLHHQFDGTKSIMSYSRNGDSMLTPYDLKAVQNLYPKKKETVALRRKK